MAGLKCITCGGFTHVFQTYRQQNTVCRRRQCLNPECKDRFSTYEIEATFFRKLMKRASIRYIQEGGYLLKVVDPEMMLEKSAEKAKIKIAKFKEREKKRLELQEGRKTQERLGPEEIKHLMQNKNK